ncbi:ferredoxin domain-containing protein [Acidaminobacter hydrogenoformans]|uniref:Uncharacterized protein, contains ferredoxin domain n=1 Tax=Acidaminobacter hydrogenoformans DSM 2784 TaxID=1120920 RepID=A0A1G5RQ75_9FIRM|nr:DUF2148 domain-containing protein [Acidaminobacter hydrogenoformans]SCZ76265.1 Uncharacterized protein, contains ferredoxin domain [Acidaminobacter hydrogenoformans DSM 2784]
MKNNNVYHEAVLRTAQDMCVAAKTAPKGRGVDHVEAMVLTGEDLGPLAERMKAIGEASGAAFFGRDAGNILGSEVVVLIGTTLSQRGVPACGMCGYEDCAKSKAAGGICTFDVTDLGIAVGSAVSLAANRRVDNRVMFSIGKAAVELGLFESDVKIAYGMPLSVKGKSPFFDRG